MVRSMDEIMSPQIYCCVHGCYSKLTYRTYKKYQLHVFPFKRINSDGKDLFFEWINAIKLPTRYTRRMKVCSLHFNEDDFIHTVGGKKTLKNNAVPSKNLPSVWRNKFYPRNYGRLVKLLEYRGVGRLRLCLQAKLMKRLKRNMAAIKEQRNKSNSQPLEQEIQESGLQMNKAFSLAPDNCPTPHHEPAEFNGEMLIKEEPLSSDELDMNNEDSENNINFSNKDQDLPMEEDSVEAMLARMNEEVAAPKVYCKGDLEDDLFCDEEEDFCHICGSDACTGHRGLEHNCGLCAKSFKTLRQLNAHNLSHFEYTKNESGRTRCKVCGEVLENVRLSEHMSSHMSSQVCMLCDKPFPNRAALMHHVNSAHTLDRAQRCRLCRKTFAGKEELDAHVRSHRVVRKEYGCRDCGLTFRSKSACWSHLNNHSRQNLRPGFECNLCSRVLSTKATLREHMFIHSGEKPFECLLCGKRIRHRANFIIHVALHSKGGALFHCPHCYTTFSTKSQLNAHVTAAHPQDKPFGCTICGMRFLTETRFVKHAITHDATLLEESLPPRVAA